MSPLGRGGIASPAVRVRVYVELSVLKIHFQNIFIPLHVFSPFLLPLFSHIFYLPKPVAGPMPRPFSDSAPSHPPAPELAATHD